MVVLAVLGGVISTQSVLASDKSLSRSCLKNNPLAVGETDANLIEIYDAYCDKKNKDVKYSYLAKAAQRFQQLGKNWKALQLVNELESLNLRGNTITDVKFLASANLANEALNQMRTTENRYLTTDITYPTAKVLSENINSAKSTIILQLEKPVKKPNSGSTTGRTTGGGKGLCLAGNIGRACHAVENCYQHCAVESCVRLKSCCRNALENAFADCSVNRGIAPVFDGDIFKEVSVIRICQCCDRAGVISFCVCAYLVGCSLLQCNRA